MTIAASVNIDSMPTRIAATDATYTENALSFMTPPNPGDLSTPKR